VFFQQRGTVPSQPCRSPGTDGITSTILKELKNSICKPLAIVFNKSLNEGYVPEDWRLANVTPIFKKGVKCKPENYRPISLTSLVCKTMESILRDKIVDHLQKNNLINPSQHGFMKQKSCLTNLLEFISQRLLTKCLKTDCLRNLKPIV